LEQASARKTTADSFQRHPCRNNKIVRFSIHYECSNGLKERLQSSQTSRTVMRTGVGAAIGAAIGAIAGGGKGAAIGAAVGAGAGAGSVFVQGREDLDLVSGTEFGLRASAPPL
jgi:outer membrane lipoprotein SlyB